jgi:hypothetical protein
MATMVAPKSITPVGKLEVPKSQHSVVLERLYGICVPQISVDRPLGLSEINQNLIHFNACDLVPKDMQDQLGLSVGLHFPQAGVRVRTRIIGQYRFGKGGRKAGVLKKVFAKASRSRVTIKETTDALGCPEFVVNCY